ncbi:MAG: PAAR domain-containing protein [Pirellulaceae bacterium]|nr:PAAR domain-containing protein [Pirellulaceae bacterium]
MLAARVSDMTATADPILPPGKPTVLTANLPQACLGDLVTGAVMTGAIVKGSATVLVCNIPAARLGDSVVGVNTVTGVPLTQAVAYPCAPTVMIGG